MTPPLTITASLLLWLEVLGTGCPDSLSSSALFLLLLLRHVCHFGQMPVSEIWVQGSSTAAVGDQSPKLGMRWEGEGTYMLNVMMALSRARGN